MRNGVKTANSIDFYNGHEEKTRQEIEDPSLDSN